VIDAFHATHKPTAWEQCNNTVSDQMWSPASRPAIELLPGILEQGVSVLLFAGELDMMCNWLGIERSIERMTWRGGTGLVRQRP
jgi:carboxypeptidase D